MQKYIELYGEEFAFVLYQWYIDNGMLICPTISSIFLGADQTDHRHALLGQDKVYASLVSKFFETRAYPELSWMHHLACRRYGDTAAALLVVSQDEPELAQQQVRHLTPHHRTTCADISAFEQYWQAGGCR